MCSNGFRDSDRVISTLAYVVGGYLVDVFLLVLHLHHQNIHGGFVLLHSGG